MNQEPPQKPDESCKYVILVCLISATFWLFAYNWKLGMAIISYKAFRAFRKDYNTSVRHWKSNQIEVPTTADN